MRRREFVTLTGALIASVQTAAYAQQQTTRVIGYLSPNPATTSSASGIVAWRDGLAESGFVEGQNLHVEYRSGNGQYGPLQALAGELVRQKVDLIMASSLPAALAAKSATSNIPIVFWVGVDPVAFGLVTSLRHPDSNLTGVTFLFNPLTEKRLQLLHELVPQTSLIGVILNPKNPNASENEQHAKSAGAALGLTITALKASNAEEIKAAFEEVIRKAVGAALVADDPYFDSQRSQLPALAAQFGVPTIYFRREFAEFGGLITYGPVFDEMARQAGRYAGQILKGTTPGDLPIAQPTKFELVVNLKSARTLGLTVPPSLLARADEVIE